MNDLSLAELNKVFVQHEHPLEHTGDSGKDQRCRQCAYERYPCLALRMATEIVRRRESEGTQGDFWG